MPSNKRREKKTPKKENEIEKENGTQIIKLNKNNKKKLWQMLSGSYNSNNITEKCDI